jgi:CheY-like chemotaxis protein
VDGRDKPGRGAPRGASAAIVTRGFDPRVLLRDLNYRVLSAHDAVSALGLIEAGDIRIDLLLTDVVLPGMNGRQLAEQAKKKRPDLKVLFTTGYSRNAIVHQGRLDPGVAMIQKPITQDGLAARIRDLLDARPHDS